MNFSPHLYLLFRDKKGKKKEEEKRNDVGYDDVRIDVVDNSFRCIDDSKKEIFFFGSKEKFRVSCIPH